MSESSPLPSPEKEVIAPGDETVAKELADDLPDPELNYGEARLWIIVRDPRCLFAYWKFRPEEHPDAIGKDGRAKFFLRIFRDSGAVANSTVIEKGAGHWFIPAQSPDSGYFADLGFFAGATWFFIARTRIFRTPPELPVAAAAPQPQFATIPAEVSLTKLRETLADAALPNESLAETAARIQSDARQHDDSTPAREWTPEREHLLAEILGVSTDEPALPPVKSFTLARRIQQKLADTAAAASPGDEIPDSLVPSAAAPANAIWPTSPGSAQHG